MAHEAQSTEHGGLNPGVVQEIATEADVDLRSVIKRLARLPVKGRSGRRIDAALARRGLPDAR